MTNRYDEHMEALETLDASTEAQDDALDAATDAMGFVQGLNDMFRDSGADIPEYPDVNVLENLVDAYHGELAAACLFLSDKQFAPVPEMLRAISDNCQRNLESGDDSTPVVVIKGYRRLADRIERTKVRMHEVISHLHKVETVEKPE